MMLTKMETRDHDVRGGRVAPLPGDGIWIRGDDRVFDNEGEDNALVLLSAHRREKPAKHIPNQTFYRSPSMNVHWDNLRYLWTILECIECRSPSGNLGLPPQFFTSVSTFLPMEQFNAHVILCARENKIISREHTDKVDILVHHHLVLNCSCCRSFVGDSCMSFDQKTDLLICSLAIRVNNKLINFVQIWQIEFIC